uniref:NADH-ubiquinone oxidoreductase chain 6 n=1 Tax=Ocellarnaca fuscotessellata TaxID=3003723 RepID=A0A9E9EWV0_9ORTH|nr:NADH dehydrogenase subunit 6 [Ocellarnaca fuscotessellata]WAM61686.1 NADH dehydrogenase subunit 6 [Ocellarnaca fuscotessellata]
MFWMLLTLMTINIFSTIIFTQLNHPLTMTLTIVFQTLLICSLTGFISQSFWFSYILFLVFLGGMLVLFIYITSLASNEMLSIPIKTIFIMFLIINLIIMISWLMDSSFTNTISTNLDMSPNNWSNSNYWSENPQSLMQLYNNPTSLNTLMLVLYLFLTLIAIVKITNIFYGPLRHIH